MKKILIIIGVSLALLFFNNLYSKENKKEKRPVKIIWESQSSKIIFKFSYDKKNNIIQADNYIDDKLVHYIVNEFDDKGNIIKESKFDQEKRPMGHKTSVYMNGQVVEAKFYNSEGKLNRVVKFDYEKKKWAKTVYYNDNDREVASINNKFTKDLIDEMIYEVKIGEKVYQRPVKLTYENGRLVNFKSNISDDGSYLNVKILYEDGEVSKQSYEWMIVSICVN